MLKCKTGLLKQILVSVAAPYWVQTGTLTAPVLLAGVRNVQPRPVGFKFHAVLVVNSAHLASQASPDTDRWLPIFWALDYFKDAQARTARESGAAKRQGEMSSISSSVRSVAATKTAIRSQLP